MRQKTTSQTNSIIKTITWRILATIITGVVAFWYTGEFGESSKITITAAMALTIAYYLHERLWVKIKN